MMKMLNFKVPDDLWAVAERMAQEAGVSIRDFARIALAEKTGVQLGVIKRGLGSTDAKTQSRVGSIGGTAKALAYKKANKPRARKAK